MFEFNKNFRQDRFEQKIKHLNLSKEFFKAEIELEENKKAVKLRDAFVKVEFVFGAYNLNYFFILNDKKYELDEKLFDAIHHYYCNVNSIGKTIKINEDTFITTIPYNNIQDELLLKYATNIIHLNDKV